jgi:phage terminase large subunit
VAGVATEVVIPYSPRPLQKVLHAAMDAHRFAVAVCHRRFGKTVMAVNQLQKKALLCDKPRPRFAYIAPTYRQGKSVAWDYMKHFARPIPGVQVNESELRVDYPNGGQVRIYGADNPDNLRGIYLDGVVLDEYGLMDPIVWEEVIRPLLTDRQGWALFIGTPNGKNQFYDIAQRAQSQPEWFYSAYKASQTHIVPSSELASARATMTNDQYAQEFECSFEASVKGAVYARELQQAREDGRITQVPYDPALPVDTNWDLGFRDATAIWFTQSAYAGAVRVIDYYEGSGYGLDHYVQYVNSKPYTYEHHWMPHDINQTEFTTGKTMLEDARAKLRPAVLVAPKLGVEDGINAGRLLLPKCYFDSEKCRAGLDALQNYRWDYNTRINDFTHLPVHDWASHGADAFRTLAVRHQTPRVKTPSASLRDRDPDDVRRGGGSNRRPGSF